MIRVLTPFVAISIAMFAGSAFAADTASPPTNLRPESGWTFAVAPYVWMSGITGTVAQFGAPPIDVDASFIDVLENFHIGLMGESETRNGRFGVAVDFQYVHLSATADTPFGLLANPQQSAPSAGWNSAG
jgi:hypothetical protein